ncbi:MAG: protein kinase [Planctomycetaceae bacterium]|nr:protein kinase [Planctomycetaceae bacterium]
MITSTPHFADDPFKSLTPKDLERVAELVDQFELAADAGNPVTIEELCAGAAHLMPAVTHSIRRLTEIEQRLQRKAPPSAPVTIGEFEVEEQIGMGGSGIVFRCRQIHPARKVAVKVLKPTVDPSEQHRRFRKELNVFSSLRCDGMAEVYVTGLVRWNGVDCFWIAMELLSGGRVDDYVGRHNLRESGILQLLLSIAGTLQAAHRSGIIHCDVKPSNILMSDVGCPHIVDFGIATISDNDQTTETDRKIGGTSAWMAPELVLGEINFANIRTDIYSFGIVACRLLTGRHPYDAEGKSLPQIVRSINGTDFVSLSRMGYPASRDLATFIERLTEHDPSRRYQNMDHVVADLERLINGDPVSVRKTSLSERAWRWCRRHVALFLLTVVIIVAALWTAGMAVVTAAKERSYTAQLARSHADLVSTNADLNQRSAELEERSTELRQLAELQERSLISARLSEIAGTLLQNNPGQAHQMLHDTTLFPRSKRRFAWDVLNAQVRPRTESLRLGTQRVLSICFSNDAKRIAYSGRDSKLYLGETVSGRLLWKKEASKLRAKICFSPDDRQIFTFSQDKQLICLNAETGLPEDLSLPKAVLDASSLVLTRDGEQLVTVTFENQLLRFSLTTGEQAMVSLPPDVEVTALWLEDSDRVISALTRDGRCLEWKISDLELVRDKDLRQAEMQFGDIVMGDGGTDVSELAVRIGCNSWAVVSALFPSGQSGTRHFSAHGDIIRDVSLVPPESMLVTMTKSSQLIPLFAPGRGRLFAEKNVRTNAHAVSADSSLIAIGDEHGCVRVYSLRIPSPLLRSFHPRLENGDDRVRGFPLAMAISHDGDRLFVGFSEGTIAEFHPPSGRLVAVDTSGAGPTQCVLLSADETWLASSVSGTNASAGIAVYPVSPVFKQGMPSSESADSIHSMERAAFIPTGRVKSLCRSTDNQRVYAGLQNGLIAVIDCQSWQVVHSWPAHGSGVYAMTVADEKLISGGNDGDIRIWSASGLEMLNQWHAHNQRILDVCMSPDGRFIFSASHDQTAAIWTADGALIQRIYGHNAPVRTIAVSDDGQTIATGSEDYTIRLWDGHTGAAQMTLRHDGDFVSELRFVGDRLLAVTHQGTIEVWGPPDG